MTFGRFPICVESAYVNDDSPYRDNVYVQGLRMWNYLPFLWSSLIIHLPWFHTVCKHCSRKINIIL